MRNEDHRFHPGPYDMVRQGMDFVYLVHFLLSSLRQSLPTDTKVNGSNSGSNSSPTGTKNSKNNETETLPPQFPNKNEVEQMSVDTLQEHYRKFPLREKGDFICDGHVYLDVPKRSPEQMRTAGQPFTVEGRLGRPFFAELMDKFSSDTDVEDDGPSEEDEDVGLGLDTNAQGGNQTPLATPIGMPEDGDDVSHGDYRDRIADHSPSPSLPFEPAAPTVAAAEIEEDLSYDAAEDIHHIDRVCEVRLEKATALVKEFCDLVRRNSPSREG